jgi:TRAP-type C4-dicarboxylate transport system substrate-binding protein
MIVSMAVLSKKWLDSLPADLRKIVLDQCNKVASAMEPISEKLYEEGRTKWKQHGGELIKLPAAEEAQMMKRVAAVGPEAVRGRAPMKQLYDLMVATAAKHK